MCKPNNCLNGDSNRRGRNNGGITATAGADGPNGGPDRSNQQRPGQPKPESFKAYLERMIQRIENYRKMNLAHHHFVALVKKENEKLNALFNL